MKIEPNADIRGMATSLVQMYTAFVDVGFEPAQALWLCGRVIDASFSGLGKRDE